jgi:tetratricopeptide (TPR) repeat protein
VIGALKKLLRWRNAGGGDRVDEPGSRVTGSAAPPDPERRRNLFGSGVAQFRAGNFRQAAALFEQVLEIAHDDADAHLNLGLARQRLGLREDAADAFAMALHFRPDYAEAHFNLGVLDLEAGDPASAATRFEEAVQLAPGYAEALSNLGLVQFRHLGRPEAAEAALERALSARPHFPDALCNLGMLRQEQGRFDDAVKLYDEALRRDPGMQEARLNRALIYLARGKYARGWEEYEARHRASTHFVRRFDRYPEWNGAPAPDRTLLVYGEQGLGDEIMFASCLPEAIASARRCVIDCSPKLEALFRRSFPAATVHGGPQTESDTEWLARVPPIDMQIAIGGLPRHFRRSESAFPRHVGYLKADAGKTARWRERLSRLGGTLKVGISWRGGTSKTRRDTRSLTLDQLLPVLAAPGARFVSLQYTDCRDELARLQSVHGVTVHHWQEAIDDYDETAALVAALDLVVSVQTAVVHLGGALGKPVWVLVPAVPEWRYLVHGDRLPWYPSVRLFRQNAPGTWQAVIEDVVSELQHLLDQAQHPGA